MRTLILPPLLFLACPMPARSEIDLLAAWQGETAGEQFGFALCIGGDANGDGWADVAIGSCTNDEGGENAGKVSVFFGRANPSAEPDLEILGVAGSFFGAAVAWAGDVNHDGYNDLLVGAYRDDQAGVNAGKAYLFLGGAPMNATPDLILVGPSAGAYFGRAVSGAGDLNRDGLADFAVGAPRTANGTVFVYFGHAPPDGTPDLLIQGLAADDRFGSSIAGPGNVDTVSGDDLLVGAPRASPVHYWQGSAYLFSGGAGLDAVADWSVHGLGAGDQFGSSLGAAGDVNGDGAPDLVVGAPYSNKGAVVDAGAAYLFYAGQSLDTTADFIIEGTADGENLGMSVAGCGNVTGSGFSHLLVGAPGSDVGGLDAGRIVLSPGGNPPRLGELILLDGEQAGDQFGYAVAGGAQISGLSFGGGLRPDIASGAWSHGSGGKSYVYGTREASSVGEPRDSCARTLAVTVTPNPGGIFAFQISSSPSLAAAREGGAVGPRTLFIRIIDASGALVRTLSAPVAEDMSGRYAARWDGRTTHGQLVPPGVYFYSVEMNGARVDRGSMVVIR